MTWQWLRPSWGCAWHLQVEKCGRKILVRLRVKTLTSQKSQFVGILAWGRDADCAWPVEVQVGELVGKPLHVLGLQCRRVVDDVEVCGCHRSLTYTLGDQIEVIPFRPGHVVVNDSSWGRVLISTTPVVDAEETGGNPLGHDDKGKLRLSPWEHFSQQALYLAHFPLLDLQQLPIRNTITEEQDALGHSFVLLLILLQ